MTSVIGCWQFVLRDASAFGLDREVADPIVHRLMVNNAFQDSESVGLVAPEDDLPSLAAMEQHGLVVKSGSSNLRWATG